MAVHVLVVDDDPAARRHIEEILKSQGQSAEGVESGEQALQRLTRSDGAPVSAMILDLVMPDMDGMTVLERLSRQALSVPVIVQTAQNAVDLGASAIRAGAVDFLVKPATPERVRVSLRNALRIGALEGEIMRMRLSRSGALSLGDVVMHSPAMERVSQLATRAARSPIPVLIEGERGVGKELLARAIHGSSPRKSRAFVTVRCDAFDAAAVETKLFGVIADVVGGKVAEAAGGTLFLDEIGALPPAAQERLARFLAEADREPKLARNNVRLIAATGSRLIDHVAAGGFRQDLFNRLNVFPIWLPPLRERRTDIPRLARGFVARLAAEAGRSVRGLSAQAMALLAAHDWPGNIRELEHAVSRAVMLCDGDELSPGDFPSIQGSPGSKIAPIRAASGVADQEHFGAEEVLLTASRTDSAGRARYGVARLLDERGDMRSIGVLEEEAIRFAIGHYGGRLSEVARRLGIGRSTLYRKMRDYGIAPGDAGEMKEMARA